MMPVLLVRWRAAGPIRFGPASGDRLTVEPFGHSDTLFHAISTCMRRLGEAEAWDAAVREAMPPVRFTSLFPFAGRALFVPPPRTLWPPAASARLRWKSARLAPLNLITDGLMGKPVAEDRWEVDSHSGCAIAAGSSAPFRVRIRESLAIDRQTAQAVPHRTACLEFQANAGLWAAVQFTDEDAEKRWSGPLKAAFRLLADSGVGGERSIGWGQLDAPEFPANPFPAFEPGTEPALYWLLSLYNPAPEDAVDWAAGSYEFAARAGLDGDPAPMAVEGSVIRADRPPRGRIVPSGAGRSGLAFALPLPAPEPSPEAAA